MNNDRIVFEEKDEQFGFTQLPNVVLTSTVLSPTDVRIYAILRRYASMHNGAMPAVSTICVEANISKATYNRSIKKFIKSDLNPNPEIPLITAIHRDGLSSVYKIHRINDYLIEKLKPYVAFSKDEKKQAKTKKKLQKKTPSQNETPYPSQNETPYPSQNETPYPSQNETPYPSQNETQVILNNNNIDNNNRSKKNVVVVSETQRDDVKRLRDQFKKTFRREIPKATAKEFVDLANRLGKDIMQDCLGPTILHLKKVMDATGEKPKNPIGALRYGIEHGWDITISKPIKPKREKRPYDVEPNEAILQRLKWLEEQEKKQVQEKAGASQ